MHKHLLPGIAIVVMGASQARATVMLNEIYAAPLAPNKEFIELMGPVGMPLAGVMVLVVDGATSSSPGRLDRAWDLSSFTIPASCLFTLGESAVSPVPDFMLTGPDSVPDRSETIYLIETTNQILIMGMVGSNVANGTNTTTIPGLSTNVLDIIAITDGTPHTVWDGALDLGPDGTALPPGIAKCGDFPLVWNPSFLDNGSLMAGHIPAQPSTANPPCAAVPGTPYCFGDGSGTACPCANNGPVGEGCLNTTGNGGRLVASGVASVASDTAVLIGSQMPAVGPCLYFQGAVQTAGGSGAAFGDGLRCASGTTIRLGNEINSGGSSQYPSGTDLPIHIKGAIPAGGGTRDYQCWYRNAGAFCTPSTFNLTNGWEMTWTP